MLKPPAPHQHRLKMVTLEELVPADHLLRLIDRHIPFDFIRDATAHLYCADNGRPAVDPVQLFKMLFIGYLFGIRSERQLVREIQVNVAYRWFLGFSLTDRVIDASTFSQYRRRRFSGSDIEQTIFDRIVEAAIEHGLIGGRVFYSDSTHLKASANKNRHDVHRVEQTPAAWLAELEAAVAADRADHGKPPLPPGDGNPPTKDIKVSRTDPEAGYMVRDGKPTGFFYLDHRTVDSQHALITDIHITPASVHDSVPYLDRLDRMRQRFGFDVGAVGLDAGYFTPAICRGLNERDIYDVIGYRRPNHREGYREYASSPTQCAHCPMKGRCTQSANGVKVVIRHVWEDHKEAVDAHRLTETGRRLYKRRKETVERSFADAKELHGHRYARFRGLAKVRAQALLAGVCQNMKKMARLLARAAARLLHALQPTRTAIGLFQSRLSNLAGEWLLAQRFNMSERNPQKQSPTFAKRRGLSAIWRGLVPRFFSSWFSPCAPVRRCPFGCAQLE